MKRKVIQIANSTQLVSLPRKWALANQIQKGDELELDIRDNALVVATAPRAPEVRTITIDVSGLGVMIKRMIGGLYRSGYDEMTLHYKDYDELRRVQEIVRDGCIGFELIDQGKNYVVIKKVSETIHQEFEHILRRMTMYLITMSKETLEAIQSGKHDQLKYVVTMDYGVNKFTDFCGRILTRSGEDGAYALYQVILQLEFIGDCYKNICRHVMEANAKLPSKVVHIISQVNDFVALVYDLIFKFGLAQLKRMYAKKQEIEPLFGPARDSCTRNDMQVVFFLQSILRAIDAIDMHILMSESMKKKLKNLQLS